ncbi:MAG: peptidylprolyl isomerase [candidate division KSB1 bacterium]|nr:peptidylprolyl isomerase [candidate division KSB1 bacterium]MDZ7340182.1 peptidylprolyl isomerase [candidate division KSB1 bacterium]
MKSRNIFIWLSWMWMVLAVVTCSKQENRGSKFRKVSFSDSTVTATVNGQAIFKHEVEIAVRQFLQKVGKDPNYFLTHAKDTTVYNQAVDWLISIRLLAQEADKNNIKVEPAEIEAAVNSFKRTFLSEQKFQDFLLQNHLTPETFAANLADELKVQKLLDQKVASQVGEITDEEALQYYNDHGEKFLQPERIRVHHILFKVTDPKDEKQLQIAQNKAMRILEKIRKGGNFETLARQNSEDPSAFKGGDLGFFAKGDMIKEFEDAAFSLKIGEVSNLVRTPLGFHIIRLDERQASDKVPFNEVRLEIRNQLKQERSTRLFENYVSTLKAKAKIRIKEMV